MSVVLIDGQYIGPFEHIDILEDRLRCDGVDYPFTVIGDYQISDDDNLAPEQVSTLSASPVVPHEITNWQAKKQLIIEGVYDQVNSAISTMDVDAQVDWNHAAVFKRDYPLILQMQALLGRTNADTDAYFIAASKLQ